LKGGPILAAIAAIMAPFFNATDRLDIAASKFDDWRERYGKVNEHNGWVPRDFWLENWESQAIIGFHLKNPLEGYRRACDRRVREHANQDAAENGGNLRCESRMDCKSFWGCSHISEWIASDEC
jgi:hypothetical protein